MTIDEHHNERFQADRDVARLAPVLRSFVQATSRTGFSVTPEDLAEIDAAEARAMTLVADAFGMMREQAEERRQNLLDFEGVELLSVGQDCFSRSVMTRWGMKKFAALGEKSGPFDLSVHQMETTIRLIETDFAGYLDTSQLVFNEKLNYPVHRGNRTHFNHETGQEFTENGFAALVERYERRIANFNAVMESGRPTLILLHHVKPQNEGAGDEIDRLWRAIEGRWGAANKLLVSVNTWAHASEVLPMGTAHPANVRMIDVAYPMPGYIWHKLQHTFSAAGCAFEREVMQQVRAAAATLRPSLTANAA